MSNATEYQARVQITLGSLIFDLQEDLYILADDEEVAEGEVWEELVKNIKPPLFAYLFSLIEVHIEEA